VAVLGFRSNLSLSRFVAYLKAKSSEKKSNHQNYKHRVVSLETINLIYLVYHCYVCARRKKIEVYVIERAEYQLLHDAAG